MNQRIKLLPADFSFCDTAFPLHEFWLLGLSVRIVQPGSNRPFALHILYFLSILYTIYGAIII